MSDDLFDDEYDPLAPPSASPAGGSVDGAHDDADTDDWSSVDDGSVTGGDGIVRIWLDDDGRLTKVRVSPVWFKKLQGSQTLDGAFAQAFLLGGARVVQPAPAEPAEDSQPDDDVPPPPEDAMEVIFERLEALRGEWDAARQRWQSEPPPPPPAPAVGRSEGVTVKLGNTGWPASVTFDEHWLDNAQVGAICTNVQLAADRARAAFVPPLDPHAEELAQFEREHDALMNSLRRMLDRKG